MDSIPVDSFQNGNMGQLNEYGIGNVETAASVFQYTVYDYTATTGCKFQYQVTQGYPTDDCNEEGACPNDKPTMETQFFPTDEWASAAVDYSAALTGMYERIF